MNSAVDKKVYNPTFDHVKDDGVCDGVRRSAGVVPGITRASRLNNKSDKRVPNLYYLDFSPFLKELLLNKRQISAAFLGVFKTSR